MIGKVMILFLLIIYRFLFLQKKLVLFLHIICILLLKTHLLLETNMNFIIIMILEVLLKK